VRSFSLDPVVGPARALALGESIAVECDSEVTR